MTLAVIFLLLSSLNSFTIAAWFPVVPLNETFSDSLKDSGIEESIALRNLLASSSAHTIDEFEPEVIAYNLGFAIRDFSKTTIVNNAKKTCNVLIAMGEFRALKSCLHVVELAALRKFLIGHHLPLKTIFSDAERKNMDIFFGDQLTKTDFVSSMGEVKEVLTTELTSTDSVKTEISKQLKYFHDRGSRKSYVLDRISAQADICGERSTIFSVMFKQAIFSITSAHSNCTSKGGPPYWISTCEDVDIALMVGCPSLPGIDSLNITGLTDHFNPGDEAFAFGFDTISQGRSWPGHVLAKRGVKTYQPHWSGMGGYNGEERVLSGVNDFGSSGGPVFIGAGSFGVITGLITDQAGHKLVLVVPWLAIRPCVEKRYEELLDACHPVPPAVPHADPQVFTMHSKNADPFVYKVLNPPSDLPLD